EHGNGRDARERIFASGKGSRFAIGLEGRHDLLRHLLKIGHLIEADGVPNADEPDLSGGHVVEQIGYSRWAGKQDRVGRKLLVGVALTGSTRAKLYKIVVLLAQRQQPMEEQKF